jgi:tetratricopeptide (TPR) repeat protein
MAGEVSQPTGVDKDEQRRSLAGLVDRYQELLAILSSRDAAEPMQTTELYITRDQIATSIEKSPWLILDASDRLASLDQAFKQSAKGIWTRFRAQLLQARTLCDPPELHWWWYADGGSAAWTIAALFLLTVCISLLTDFTRRLLSANPDAIGIAAIASQAVFTVAASSTFTSAGRMWMRGLLSRENRSPARQDLLKCVAVLALLAVVFPAWLFLPHGLAAYYNSRGLNASAAQPSVAMEDFNRAISLNPSLVEPYVNLATLYVQNYDFDKAAGEFRKALIVNVGHISAYNDLAYVLLLGKDPATALRVMDEAFRRQSPASLDPQDAAAMYKNLAWAEYQTGFYADAARDAALGAKADNSQRSSYCVLAKALTKLNRSSDALHAWAMMSAIAPIPNQPIVDPDCTRLAEEAMNDKH